MAEKKIKHGGCKDCGSKEQEILVSTFYPQGPDAGMLIGSARCDACNAKLKAKYDS